MTAMTKFKLPERIYKKFISKDLEKKMVFIGGPRQVGKTTLAQSFLDHFLNGHPAYLNWDNELNRQIINKALWPKDTPLIIFDEIHKRKGWQKFIKGHWDTWKTINVILSLVRPSLIILEKVAIQCLAVTFTIAFIHLH